MDYSKMVMIVELLSKTVIDDNSQNVRQGYYYCSQEDYNNFILALDDEENIDNAINIFKTKRHLGSLEAPPQSDRKYMTCNDIYSTIGKTLQNLTITGANITDVKKRVRVSAVEPTDKDILFWIKE